MRIIFEASEAQYEPHEDTGISPVALSQPCNVVVDVPGSWVQLTYDYLRFPEDGDHIAIYGEDGFWKVLTDLPVTKAYLLDGTPVEAHTVKTTDMLFSDVVVQA